MERPYSKGWFTEYGIFKKDAKTLFWLVHKMEQGFSCSTPAFRNNDILEGICRKKSNVICNLLTFWCEATQY